MDFRSALPEIRFWKGTAVILRAYNRPLLGSGYLLEAVEQEVILVLEQNLVHFMAIVRDYVLPSEIKLYVPCNQYRFLILYKAGMAVCFCY